MTGRASFGKTWLSLRTDLRKLRLEPFNLGLTVRQKFGYTAGLAVFAIVFMLVLDPFGAVVVFGIGAWAIWNRNNAITKKEKKVFLGGVATAAFLALLEPFAVLLQATLFLVIMYAVTLWVIWRA